MNDELDGESPSYACARNANIISKGGGNLPLKTSANHAMLGLLDIDELIMLKKKQKYLEKHTYAIWQSKDGKYWYTTFPDETKPRGVRQIRRKSKEELEEAIVEYWEENEDSITLEEAFESANEKKLKVGAIQESTFINRKYYFNHYFGDIKEKDVRILSASELAEYLDTIIQKFSISSMQFAHVRSVLHDSLEFARKRGYISFGIDGVKSLMESTSKSFHKVIKEDETQVYNEEETKAIIDYLKENDDTCNLCIMLMFVTGMRVGEVVALKKSDIIENIVRIRRTITRASRENKSVYTVKDFPKTSAGIRDIVVPSSYRWLLDRLKGNGDDSYIITNRKGSHIYEFSIYRRLKRICEKLDIPFRSPHKIRKTYGSILLDNGVDSKFVMEQMGHSSIACTETFYHKNRKTIARKTDILDKIDEFSEGKSDAPMDS